MENEARFNLNRALQNWKAELAAQPGIGTENIRELETHLLESINAFKKRGCSDYAAFSLARQKLGSVQQLAAEFARENLLKVWRDRVFWMTAFAFFLQLNYMAAHPVFERLAAQVAAALGLSRSWIVLGFLDAIPQLLIAIAMATGFAEVIFRRLHWIFAARWRLAAAGVIAIAGARFVATSSTELSHAISPFLISEIGFLAFAVFVKPTEFATVLATSTSARWRSSIDIWRDRLFWAVLGCLAICVWTLVSQMAAVEVVRIKGPPALNNPWVIASYFIAWLLPMAVVGLLLASARLSVLAQWLRTRSRVGFITCALALIWVVQVLWIWQWAPTPDYLSTAAWNLQIQRNLLSGIIFTGGLIAITLWAIPSCAGQQQEDALKFE